MFFRSKAKKYPGRISLYKRKRFCPDKKMPADGLLAEYGLHHFAE